METLREISLEAYDRLIGLELADLAVDGCITKAPPLAVGRKREEARWIGEKEEAPNARRWWTQKASLWGPSAPRPTVTTRRCWRRPSTPWERSESCRIGRACISGPRLRLEGYPREAGDPRPDGRDRREGQAGSLAGRETLGRGAHESSWHNAHKKLVWCTERCGGVIDFWVAFSDVVIIVRRLIREGWTRYRWESRPSRRP